MFWFDEKSEIKKKKELTKEQELETLVWQFFMEKIPRLKFEQREGQEDMSLDICSSIVEKKHTIVEAGVGIGKSYAYIVPLLYYNKLFKKPVIIATSTIALQEQLIEDIKRVCTYINYRPELVLAKGMTHFACKKRADTYLKPKVQKGLSEDAETLYRYIYGGKVDRRYINMDLDEDMWNEVKVEITDHNKCRYFKSCRFMELRREMFTTEGIILCNQDLLTVHFQKLRRGQKGLLNPEADVLVIDEAHNLEEKVRTSLIESFTRTKIRNLMYEAAEDIKDRESRNHIRGEIKNLDNLLYSIFADFKKQIDIQVKRNRDGEDLEKFFVDLKRTEDLNRKAAEIIKSLVNIMERDKDNSISEDILDELDNLKNFFMEIIKEKGNYLFWLESNKQVELFACPEDMADEIKTLYFDKLKTTILTSATIADRQQGSEEERYGYFIRNTGFPVKDGFLSAPKPSPFPYDKNTMLYYGTNLPHPVNEREKFIVEATERIEKLLEITEGRALILFTAKSDLNKVYNIIKDKKPDYKLLKQGSTSSQEELLNQFRNDEHSVLFATGTYWEGIDVPGKPLSNLIIFKLPFPVPDPILEHKRRSTGDFLMEVSVPLMIVKLRQGVGRLIRKHEDKGIVAILDPRLGEEYKRKYAEVVFEALPVKRKTTDLKEIKRFWDKIERS